MEKAWGAKGVTNCDRRICMVAVLSGYLTKDLDGLSLRVATYIVGQHLSTDSLIGGCDAARVIWAWWAVFQILMRHVRSRKDLQSWRLSTKDEGLGN